MPQKQRERELFVSDRPVRSDFSRDINREKVYARRRVITVSVLLLVVCGSVYGFWGRRSHNPSDIPLIKSEGSYKQKPTDPGGIDIPHQDVEIYDKMDNHPTSPPGVEHLLPPPETPEAITHSAAPVPTQPATQAPPSSPAPEPESVSAPAQASAVPMSAPEAAPAAPDVSNAPLQLLPEVPNATPANKAVDNLLDTQPAKVIATTVRPSSPTPIQTPDAQPAARADEAQAPKTIEDILKSTQTPQTAPVLATQSVPPARGTGNVVIQLASVSDQGAAQGMLATLQKKYADDLSGITLSLQRADLGSRGIYYRIQSQKLPESDANRICLALKQKNAGCILVRK